VVAAAAFVTTKAVFYLVAAAAGVAMGSSQSASRSLVGLFTPSFSLKTSINTSLGDTSKDIFRPFNENRICFFIDILRL